MGALGEQEGLAGRKGMKPELGVHTNSTWCVGVNIRCSRLGEGETAN
jgi:hypothetical protein